MTGPSWEMGVSLGCIQHWCVGGGLRTRSAQLGVVLGRLALCLRSAAALGLQKLPSALGHSALLSDSRVQCLVINLVTFHTHLCMGSQAGSVIWKIMVA